MRLTYVRALKLRMLRTRCVYVFHTVFKTKIRTIFSFLRKGGAFYFGAERAFFNEIHLSVEINAPKEVKWEIFCSVEMIPESSFVAEHGIKIPINSYLSVCEHWNTNFEFHEIWDACIYQCGCVFTLNWKQPSQIHRPHFFVEGLTDYLFHKTSVALRCVLTNTQFGFGTYKGPKYGVSWTTNSLTRSHPLRAFCSRPNF